MTEAKSKVDSGGIIAVGAIGIGAIALYFILKGGQKVTFSPTSGKVGVNIAVSGTKFTTSDTVSKVTLGGAQASHTLKVDASGNLLGLITVPQVTVGTKDIVITLTKDGAKTFKGAFKVTDGSTPTGWERVGNLLPFAITPTIMGWERVGSPLPFTISPTVMGWERVGNLLFFAISPTVMAWEKVGSPFPFTISPQAITYWLQTRTEPPLGEVSVYPDKAEYTRGERVELEATPWGGYYNFDYWDINGYRYDENPLVLYMEGNYIVTAHFSYGDY